MAKTRRKSAARAPVVKPATGAGLSGKEVCDIIATCRQHRVLSLTYAGLSLTFDKSLDDNPEQVPVHAAEVSRLPPKAQATEQQIREATERLAAVKASEQEAKDMEQVEARELYLQNLSVTDPEEFERIMMTETANAEQH